MINIADLIKNQQGRKGQKKYKLKKRHQFTSQKTYSYYMTKSDFWQMNLIHQKSDLSHNELYGKKHCDIVKRMMPSLRSAWIMALGFG